MGAPNERPDQGVLAMAEKITPVPGELCVVPEIPACNFCKDGTPGEYDFKTVYGPWAHGCETHWQEHRAYPTLGVGKGQKWVVLPA